MNHEELAIKAANAVGVTPRSDMRPYVEQAVKWALKEAAHLPPSVAVKALGRFGHHPEPAIDFCIEVEALEGHLFDAKHGIGKPGHEPRSIDDDFRRRVSEAMDFIVGGDQIAIAAKATLRALSAQVQDVAEGWHVASNNGSVLIYCLKQDGWRKGEAVMVNDIMIRVENANRSSNELQPIVDAIMRALPVAPAKQE